MVAAEAWVDEIASTLGMEPEAVRSAHIYAEGDITHFTMVRHHINAR